MGDLHLEADMLEEDESLLPPRQVPSNKYNRIAVAIAGIAVLVLVAMVASRSPDGGSVHVTRDTDIEQKMLAPGYHSQECNAHKQCPDADKYCHYFLCVSCLQENAACSNNGQCCHGSCSYGRCKKGASKGDAGTFCDRKQDCTGPELCCVREPAINPHISICKPALDEHEICGPRNHFKAVYIGATKQPACGPCKAGLTCKQYGVHGVHEICTKEA